jgi:uncharacterized membrane protein
MSTTKEGWFTNKAHAYDPVWHVQLAVLLALALQVLLPDRFVAGPRYLLPILEALLLALVAVTTPRLPEYRSTRRKFYVIALIALISAANIYSLQRVVSDLLTGGHISSGQQLILASINIFLTNIIIFGMWYWEMDGGGPGLRRGRPHHQRDFLYPQMRDTSLYPSWHPTFIDYLYLSYNNASTFGPGDTLPTSRRAKMLMLIQSLVSLSTLVLVAARAVGILA